MLFIYIYILKHIGGQVPYTVTVIAINSAGRGEKNKMIVFTEEGSKCLFSFKN